MPVYANGLLNPLVTMLLRGKNGYSIGGFNDQAGRTQMLVTNVALTTNVATLSCTIIAGDAPLVGATAYIQGTTSTGGAFNSTAGVVLTGSSFTGTTGTITYALTHANVGSAPDVGIVLSDPAETTESVTTGTVPYKGKQFGLPQASVGRSGGDTISWAYFWPGTAPGSCTVQLQGAPVDVDAQYTVLDSGTSTSGEQRPPLSVSGATGVNFLRVVVTAISGGPSACVAKITV